MGLFTDRSEPAALSLHAVLLVIATVGFAGLAWAAFTLGLRRYASGSAWSRD